jgi:hypothetical protein
MNNCVTVWAERPKITNRVNTNAPVMGGHRLKMVDVDEASCRRAITISHQKPAYKALTTISFDTQCPSLWIAFIPVDQHAPARPRIKIIASRNFLWQRNTFV